MDTKYTNALKDNTAIMMLYGEIGHEGLSAEYFTEEMSWHHNQGRKIKVYINTPGGSVFGGYSIIQAIIDFEADTHIVGLAASMGGVISQFGVKRTANDFATGMIHMPHSAGDDRLLEIVAKQLKDILVKRSKISEDQMDEIMAKDTFFDASEMLALGLIDEIVSTNVASKPVYNGSVSDLYNVYNKILTKKSEMKKLQDHFKLTGEVTEDNILNSITDLENVIQTNTEDVAAKDAEISKLQSDLEELRTGYATLNNSLAETVVDNAIADGKIEKSTKDLWLDAAKKDTEAVKAQLESLKAVQNTSVQTTIINGKTIEKPEDDIVAWVRSEVGARKLIDLEDSDKDEYERIWNLYEEKLAV